VYCTVWIQSTIDSQCPECVAVLVQLCNVHSCVHWTM